MPCTVVWDAMTVKGGSRAGEIQSLHRALDLLQAIGRSGEIGVTELARESGLAVSTVHYILQTLSRRSFVTNQEGRYTLGPAVTVLAAQDDPRRSLATLVKPAVTRITNETGQAASATVLVGQEAHLVAFDPGPGPVTIKHPQWMRKDALIIPTGRVMVAMTRRQDEWPDFIDAPLPEESEESKWSAARWRDELQSVASTGLCVRRAKSAEGQTAVAVPIWARGPAVVCAIGSSAPGFLTTDELTQHMMDVLWSVAGELSATLGCERIPLPKPQIPAKPSL